MFVLAVRIIQFQVRCQKSFSNDPKWTIIGSSIDDPMDGDEATRSIVFIGEKKTTADVKKIRELYKIFHDQTIRIRRLKLHVKELQNIILHEKKTSKIERGRVIDDDETKSNVFELARQSLAIQYLP